MKRIRRHVTFANITSVLALLVALSGGAYAAATITGADIKNGTVTTKDVKNGTLKSVDLSGGLKKSIAQSGARAVITVWGDTNGCYVIASLSRGSDGTCNRSEAGVYVLGLSPSVNTSYTSPICEKTMTGVLNNIYSYLCGADFSGGGVQVTIVRVDETNTTAPRSLSDVIQTSPVVVVVP